MAETRPLSRLQFQFQEIVAGIQSAFDHIASQIIISIDIEDESLCVDDIMIKSVNEMLDDRISSISLQWSQLDRELLPKKKRGHNSSEPSNYIVIPQGFCQSFVNGESFESVTMEGIPPERSVMYANRLSCLFSQVPNMSDMLDSVDNSPLKSMKYKKSCDTTNSTSMASAIVGFKKDRPHYPPPVVSQLISSNSLVIHKIVMTSDGKSIDYEILTLWKQGPIPVDDCSSFVIDIRQYNAKYDSVSFPVIFYHSDCRHPCDVCQVHQSEFASFHDTLGFNDPMILCQDCANRLHFCQDGTVLHHSFTLKKLL